jgi:hypothetical protein
MNSSLELIRRRIDEIESQLAAPRNGTVTASCDFLRQVIQEQAALGEEVVHNGAGAYRVGDIEIQASGELPKGSFLIQLIPE